MDSLISAILRILQSFLFALACPRNLFFLFFLSATRCKKRLGWENEVSALLSGRHRAGGEMDSELEQSTWSVRVYSAVRCHPALTKSSFAAMSSTPTKISQSISQQQEQQLDSLFPYDRHKKGENKQNRNGGFQ